MNNDKTTFYLPMLTLCVPVIVFWAGVHASSDAFWSGIWATTLFILCGSFTLIVQLRLQDHRSVVASHKDDPLPDWSDVKTPESLKGEDDD